MADDDNFDIDIYGDDSGQAFTEPEAEQGDAQANDASMNVDTHTAENAKSAESERAIGEQEPANTSAGGQAELETGTQQIASTGASANNQAFQKQAPQQQGTKRKQGADDDRPTAPGATAALMINDLNWWISEDDIRGWANQSGCEDELNEVTFNEHKVNGKSKGQVYVQLQSPQAATALKHQIEALYQNQAHSKKPTAIFNAPHVNPFKTLPKDVPQREKNNRGDRSSSSGFSNHSGQGGNYNNRFHNNRGNFNNRGNSMGFQNRNNFNNPAGNMGGGNMGGYGNPTPMANFGNAGMGGINSFGGGFNRGGGMNNFGGGFNRGGGMNNRGRGGMGFNGPPGGMGMPVAPNMGMMGMMGGGMSGGMGVPANFGGNQGFFSPAFFGQNQQPQQGGGGDGNWNPHGAKRPRPE